MAECSGCRETPMLFLAVFFDRFVSGVAVVMRADRRVSLSHQVIGSGYLCWADNDVVKAIRGWISNSHQIAGHWLDKCSFSKDWHNDANVKIRRCVAAILWVVRAIRCEKGRLVYQSTQLSWLILIDSLFSAKIDWIDSVSFPTESIGE